VIVDVDKYLFMGLQGDLDLFFAKAQHEGVIEFIQTASKKPYVLPKLAQDILTAIKILKKEKSKPESKYGKEYSVQELVDRVVFLKNTLEKHHEEQRVLSQDLTKIRYFGDFSFEEIRELEKESKKCVQFFFRNHSKRQESLPSAGLIYIASDLHVDYYLGIHEKPHFFANFVELRFEKSLSELKERLALIEEELKLYHEELQRLVDYVDFLTEHFIHETDKYSLQFSKEKVETYFEDKLFSVEAWIPKEDLPAVEALVSKMHIHMEKIAIDAKEKIPTCMKNEGTRKIGEDLVKIYDIPSSADKDPSGFVIASFSVFFSMIVADAGYGFLYLLLSLFAYAKLAHKSALLKRMIKLFVLISSCCVVWGVVIGSYFGIELTPQSPLRRVSLTQELVLKKAVYHMQEQDDVYASWVRKIPDMSSVKTPLDFVLAIKHETGSSTSYEILEEFNNSILMEIALLVGVIHIMISLFRYIGRNLSAIGWICFIIGGYLFFPSMMGGATSIFNFLGLVPKKLGAQIGMQLVFIGVGVAWILALVQHKKKGLEEPLKSIQIFADVLSYLRLYALSLAGIIMAETFNQLGRDVSRDFGYVLGIFIIIGGHLLNMTIGLMGGFIHGLRLNFLEWYHYSFDGGGKLFNPLRFTK